MPPSNRSRRTKSNQSEYDDDDGMDSGSSADAGQEKMRQLMIDLLGRWHWIVLGLVLGIIASVYYLSKIPKEYTATATLLVKQQTSSVMSKDQVEEIDMSSQEAMNTVAERIRRMDLLERVGSRQDVRDLPGIVPTEVDWVPVWVREKLGSKSPDVDPLEKQVVPPPTALGAMMSAWLNVSIRPKTRLLDISITHPIPEVSKTLADAIAREYLAEIANARTEGRSSSIDLLEKESKQARISLQAARGAMSIYARTLEVHNQLDAKETEISALQRKYLPKHPKMVSATSEVKRLQDQFLKEFDTARNGTTDKAYWDTAKSDLPDHATKPDEYLRTARQQLLARIGVLESEIQSSTTVFNSMLTRIEESNVNQESVESSSEVSSLARVPGPPSSPVPSKIIGAGGIAGLTCGLFLAFVLVRLDNRFHTVSQISAETGCTILAAISEMKSQFLKSAGRKENAVDKLAGPDPRKNWDERLVFRPGISDTNYAEMFRILRASVSLLGDEKKRKITLFTSALPGEGKSSISANFALAAAGQGKKTLLIDLDLRKPSLHKIFGLPKEQENGGITECLANLASFEDVVIKDSGQSNLHLILSGKRAPNPGELLETGRLTAVLEQACRMYDIVVLDTAPLLAVPDTRIVAPLANNVCLVVRADYTPKGAVSRVLEVIEDDDTSLSGIVFNGFKEKRRLMGQNYSYGSYNVGRYGRAYRYGYGYGSDEK